MNIEYITVFYFGILYTVLVYCIVLILNALCVDHSMFDCQSSKIARGTKGDASELKPTLLAAVPVSRSDTDISSEMCKNSNISLRKNK